MATLSTLVPTSYVLTSGPQSQMYWTNMLTLSTAAVSSLSGNSIGANALTLNSTLSVSTLTSRTVNVSTITGSSISSNTLTLSLVNASTQNTQIYQVATTNPTTSYTAIQASHVSTGTTNNALVLNPGGGNVGVGTTNPSANLHIIGATSIANTTTLKVLNSGAGLNGTGSDLVTTQIDLGAGYGPYLRAVQSNSFYTDGIRLDLCTNPAINTTTPTPRLTILPVSGNVGIGTTSPGAPLTVKSATGGNEVIQGFVTANQVFAVYGSTNTQNGGWNAADTILRVSKDFGNSRSINASGTFNASGADYAEYMTKDSDFAALKGDLLGVLPSGKLTNQFDAAIHFLLKSTNPCMVGGDVWGTEEIVGEKPKEVEKDATEEQKAAHAVALADWESRLEAERQKVDRVAFAGQVPVNIQGTTPGDYIIPARNADGTIGVAAVSKADMTFAQYQSAVGRVISILADGRANVVVKAV